MDTDIALGNNSGPNKNMAPAAVQDIHISMSLALARSLNTKKVPGE